MSMAGESALASSAREHAAGHAHGVLQGHGLLVDAHLLRVGEQEEVAGLVQVDHLSGPVREVLERVEAAHAEGDVDGVGELRAHAAGRLHGGPAAQRPSLEEQDVGDAGLGEVEGDAGPHDAAADDDDPGRLRQLRRSVGGHAKLTPCASGRSFE